MWKHGGTRLENRIVTKACEGGEKKATTANYVQRRKIGWKPQSEKNLGSEREKGRAIFPPEGKEEEEGEGRTQAIE